MDSFDDLITNSRPAASHAAPALDNPYDEGGWSQPASFDPWSSPYSNDPDAGHLAASQWDDAPSAGHHTDPPSRDPEPEQPAAPVVVDNGPLPIPDDSEDEAPPPPKQRPQPTPPAPVAAPEPVPAEADSSPTPASAASAKASEADSATRTPSPPPPRSASPSTSSRPTSPIVSPTTSSLPTPLASQTPLADSAAQSRSSTPITPGPSAPSSGFREYTPASTPLDQAPPAHVFREPVSLGAEVANWGPPGASSFAHRDDLPPVPSYAQDGPYGVPAHTHTTESAHGADDPDNEPLAQTAARINGKKEAAHTFVITVGDPQKVGDTISAHIIYTVHTKTDAPGYRKSEFSVLRRYSDFLWLYDTLSLNNPGVIVPPVPEKQPLGRFAEDFVENRRRALATCIQKMADHPTLTKDPDLKLFLESDNFALEVKHRKDDRAGLLSSLGSVVGGSKYYETDEWLEQRKSYMDGLEQTLRGLAKSIDAVSKQRVETAGNIAEFADALSQLSQSQDLSPQLSKMIDALVLVEKNNADAQTAQARDDVATVMGTINEYARLISSVRLAFTSRARTHAAWQKADSEARRVRNAHESARRQGRIPPERMGHSLAEIAEAEKRANDAQHEFENVGKLLRSELLRFEQERVEDFRDSLQEFLEAMIVRQKKLIKTWENYQEMLLSKAGANATPRGQQQQPPQEDGHAVEA